MGGWTRYGLENINVIYVYFRYHYSADNIMRQASLSATQPACWLRARSYTDMQRTNFTQNVLSCRSCWNLKVLSVGQKQHSRRQRVRLVSHMPAGVMGD